MTIVDVPIVILRLPPLLVFELVFDDDEPTKYLEEVEVEVEVVVTKLTNMRMVTMVDARRRIILFSDRCGL